MKNIDIARFCELASSDKLYFNDLILDKIKSEGLLDYKGDFELNASMVIGPVERKTNNRFKNYVDFESYINAIDIDYDSKEVTFTGYVFGSENTSIQSC